MEYYCRVSDVEEGRWYVGVRSGAMYHEEPVDAATISDAMRGCEARLQDAVARFRQGVESFAAGDRVVDRRTGREFTVTEVRHLHVMDGPLGVPPWALEKL